GIMRGLAAAVLVVALALGAACGPGGAAGGAAAAKPSGAAPAAASGAAGGATGSGASASAPSGSAPSALDAVGKAAATAGLEKVDWAALGVGPRSISYDGSAVMTASTFVAPAYNPNLVSAADAPKDWGDLADPRWRGKMGVSTATHFWARLAQAWGDERVTR